MKLSSGMEARELIARASAWWDATGRHAVNQSFNQERKRGTFKAATNNAPGFKIADTDETVLPSGILNRLPWDALQKDERMRICQVYHQVMVLDRQNGYDVDDPGHFRNVAARREKSKGH